MNDWGRADVLRLSKILQVISHLGIFIVPTLVFSYLVSPDTKTYLSLQKPTPFIWFTLPIIFIALVLLNSLMYQLNRSIDFSFISSEFQYQLEYSQALSDKKIHAFVGATPLSFFVNLFVICLIPAIGEEIAFRGLLQKIGIEWTKSVYLGITFSAVLFAVIHWQPFNTIPIFILGWIYGYIVFITGSIWITMVLHFLNNAFGLVALHLSKSDDVAIENFNPYWSIVIVVISAFVLYKWLPLKKMKDEGNY